MVTTTNLAIFTVAFLLLPNTSRSETYSDVVSYVIEPFEAAFDREQSSSSLFLSGVEYFDATRLDDGPLTTTLSSDSYVGSASIQLNYENDDVSYFLQGFAPANAVFNCRGASHVSLAYKNQHEEAAALRWRFFLFDNENCDDYNGISNNNCGQDTDKLEAWEYVGNSELFLQQNQEWQELQFSTDQSFWKHVSGQGNGRLDLDRLKVWRFEFTPTLLSAEEKKEGEFFLLLDHLRLVGGGDLFASVFYTESIESAKKDSQFNSYYQGSVIAETNTQETLSGNGEFLVNYTIEQMQVWGGSMQYTTVLPSRAYFNLSQADAISLDYHILQAATPAGRVHLRFNVYDASHCKDNCGFNAYNMENYYSFHYILDYPSDSKGTLSIELHSGQDDSSFVLTGWYGILGNEVFDKDSIKAYTVGITVNAEGDVGSLVSGEILLSNLTAMGESVIVVDEEPPACKEETGVALGLSTEFNYSQIAFLQHRECCKACDADPSCLYGTVSNNRFCYLAQRLYPDQIRLRSDDRNELNAMVFWKDDDGVRGSFCDKCLCDEARRTIDCRGRDLLIVPKIFDEEWQPSVLDLRNNSGLVWLPSGSLEEISSSVRELRLPESFRYISRNNFKDMPSLEHISFEGKNEGDQLQLINAIAESDDDVFSDVCCGLGDTIKLGNTSQKETWTFCNYQAATAGSDTLYEEFVRYENATVLRYLTPNSSLMFEAAESASLCAEYCQIQEECRYFVYDTDKVCKHLTDQGIPKRKCCDNNTDYADVDLGLPRFTSGHVPVTRFAVDNARVLFMPLTLEANKGNQYTVQYHVYLGAMPMRGSVRVYPKVTSSTNVDVSFSPQRIVLYDNTTIIPVDVSVSNNGDPLEEGLLVLGHSIVSCDTAFVASDDTCTTGDDNSVFINVKLPKESNILALALSIAAIVVVGAIISVFYVSYKIKQADTVWHVEESDLTFKDPPHVLGRGTFGYVLLADYRGTQVAVKRVLPRRSESNVPLSRNSSFSEVGEEKFDAPNTSNTTEAKSSSSDKNNKGKRRGTETMSGTLASSVTGSGETRLGCWERMIRLGRQQHSVLKADFVSEMRHLSKLRHPCITTVMGAVIYGTSDPMLVMEYMELGSLYDLLHNESICIHGEQILPILRDIASGVRFLHAAKPCVIHGDLKSQNILVDMKFRAKVADFGLSQKKRLGSSGTPYWMAPELLRRESSNTAQSDVYSFGITLYELYSREEPYQGEDFDTVLKQVVDPLIDKRPPVPKSCPDEIKKMMIMCCNEYPGDRPSFEILDIQLKGMNMDKVEPFFPITEEDNLGRSVGALRTEAIFNDVFPPHVAKALNEGKKVEPEHKEMVTVYFSDMVGFADISSALGPLKVSDLVDRLYSKFDELSRKHGVFKVDTFGDNWMGVTNLVQDQPDHTVRMARFALDAVAAAQDSWIDPDDHDTFGKANIRVGFHSGPIVASVVGSRNPQYCIFGDTVNTASRMESHTTPGTIQCSEISANNIEEQGDGIELTCRGRIQVKGKGKMRTYFVGTNQEHGIMDG